MREPSPTKAVVKKVIACLVCAFIYMKFSSAYPIGNIKGEFRVGNVEAEFISSFPQIILDDAFIDGLSIPYTFWFAMMCTTIVRFKYYFAWLLADAICNNAGLGFNGYDEDASPKWDLFTNIYVIPVEVSTKLVFTIKLALSWQKLDNLPTRKV